MLLGRCLTELGTALVHSIRGYDDEGAVILATAVDLATAAGAEQIAAKALSELAYVDVLAGRRASAAEYLRAAGELTSDDPVFAAALAGFDAMNLSDWGKLEASAEQFGTAVELRRSAERRPPRNVESGSWERAPSFFSDGWTKRLSGPIDRASSPERERWTAFRPWPEAWLAHIRLARGDDPSVVRESRRGDLRSRATASGPVLGRAGCEDHRPHALGRR